MSRKCPLMSKLNVFGIPGVSTTATSDSSILTAAYSHSIFEWPGFNKGGFASEKQPQDPRPIAGRNSRFGWLHQEIGRVSFCCNDTSTTIPTPAAPPAPLADMH